MLVQVDLRSAALHLTCWVEPRVNVGDRITLRNHPYPDRWWDVVRVSAPRAASEINRGWDNNI